MIRALVEFERNTDPRLLALCLYLVALGLIGGWAICQVTHKQRGIEVDRPITDNLPGPPPPIVVPDHVPDDWPANWPDPDHMVGPNMKDIG